MYQAESRTDSSLQTSRAMTSAYGMRLWAGDDNTVHASKPVAWFNRIPVLMMGKQPPEKANQANPAAYSDATRRRVLVVDDEELVRRTLSLFLIKAGFSAVAVNSGAEAMEVLQGEGGQGFDLLVTDQSMPGLTGCELIEKVAQLRPGLPALLVTGYNMADGHGEVPSGITTLYKPFERAAFLDRVQALLGLIEK